MTSQDFEIYTLDKKGGEIPVTDFSLSTTVAENIDSVTLTRGEDSITIPVVICEPQSYRLACDCPVYDSAIPDAEQVTVCLRYDGQRVKKFPLADCEDVRVIPRAEDYLIIFADEFGRHTARLLKTPVTKLLCADTLCPNEPLTEQEIELYAVYENGHIEPLERTAWTADKEIYGEAGLNPVPVRYRGTEYPVVVCTAAEEIHPIRIEAPADKGTLKTSAKDASGVCFIGDSRLGGLRNSVESNAFFISRTAASLYWLKGEAEARFSAVCGSVDTVIVLMGINDLYHPEDYAAYMNEFAEKYSDKRVIFLSLTPVDEETEKLHGYRVTNEQVRQFNSVLKEKLGEKVELFNLYDYMWHNGFTTMDGVHYLRDDYIRMYNRILESL